MADGLKHIPLMDNYETTLATEWNGQSNIIKVDKLPDIYWLDGANTYITINPGKQNMQVVEVIGMDKENNTFIIGARHVYKGVGKYYIHGDQPIVHPVGSIVRMSDNFMYFKEIKEKIDELYSLYNKKINIKFDNSIVLNNDNDIYSVNWDEFLAKFIETENLYYSYNPKFLATSSNGKTLYKGSIDHTIDNQNINIITCSKAEIEDDIETGSMVYFSKYVRYLDATIQSGDNYTFCFQKLELKHFYIHRINFFNIPNLNIILCRSFDFSKSDKTGCQNIIWEGKTDSEGRINVKDLEEDICYVVIDGSIDKVGFIQKAEKRYNFYDNIIYYKSGSKLESKDNYHYNNAGTYNGNLVMWSKIEVGDKPNTIRAEPYNPQSVNSDGDSIFDRHTGNTVAKDEYIGVVIGNAPYKVQVAGLIHKDKVINKGDKILGKNEMFGDYWFIR